MDRQMQVGDLAVIVRPGCTDEALGVVIKVLGFYHAVGCNKCGRIHGPAPYALHSGFDGGSAVSVSRLKRIPPLDELEGQCTEETLREPALHR